MDLCTWISIILLILFCSLCYIYCKGIKDDSVVSILKGLFVNIIVRSQGDLPNDCVFDDEKKVVLEATRKKSLSISNYRWKYVCVFVYVQSLSCLAC